jgi:hypothetical protein
MAKLYSVENLLVGKEYNSRTLDGTIIEAEKTDKVYFGNDNVAYLVKVRQDKMFRDSYRYIAVKVEE